MKIAWHANAWEDYLWWQSNDKKVLKRINDLIKDILRNPIEGVGKPEALRRNLQGFYSRRINGEYRLVYTVIDDEWVVVA